LSKIFSHKKTKVLGIGRKTSEIRILSITCSQGYTRSAWYIIVDVDLDDMAKVMLVRFTHIKITSFPLTYCAFFKKSL
jgi:hypothetical protein